MNSLPDMFRTVARQHPDRPAVLHKADGGLAATGYRDVLTRIDHGAAALVLRGLRPGEAVLLVSENRSEWLLADLAIQSAGGVTVPLYPTLPAEQVQPLAARVRARFAIVENGAQLAKLLARQAELPLLEQVICFEPADGGGALAVSSWSELLAAGAACDAAAVAEVDRRVAALTPDDIATIIFTSGTTGEPKGAMLTQGNLVSNAGACVRFLGITPDDVSLIVLPQSHVFQRTLTYVALQAGAAVLFCESLRHLLADLALARPTLLCVVPRMLVSIRDRLTSALRQRPAEQAEAIQAALAVAEQRAAAYVAREPLPAEVEAAWARADEALFAPLRAQLGLDRCRCLISGGAALPADVGRWYYGLGIKISQGYGLTETSPVIAVNDPDGWVRFDGIGPPLAECEARLADDGELLTRGPCVMKGYFEMPEQTAEVLEPDGWFHTGDLADWTPEGHLRIVDRKKNILVLANGKKVAPTPIEDRLAASPLIAAALLIGDDQDMVTALIVPAFEALHAALQAEGVAVERDEQEAWVQRPEAKRLVRAEVERLSEGLAPFEKVRRFRLLHRDFSADQGELTPTLKRRREVIVQHFAELVKDMARGRH